MLGSDDSFPFNIRPCFFETTCVNFRGWTMVDLLGSAKNGATFPKKSRLSHRTAKREPSSKTPTGHWRHWSGIHWGLEGGKFFRRNGRKNGANGNKTCVQLEISMWTNTCVYIFIHLFMFLHTYIYIYILGDGFKYVLNFRNDPWGNDPISNLPLIISVG